MTTTYSVIWTPFYIMIANTVFIRQGGVNSRVIHLGIVSKFRLKY